MAKEIITEIDGCLCEPVDPTDEAAVRGAVPIPGAVEQFRRWRAQGYSLCLFTARPASAAVATEQWLAEQGVPYDRVIYGKPAADEYHYIDAKSVRASRFSGCYGDFVRTEREILVFPNPDDRYRRRILVADRLAAEALDYLHSVPGIEVETTMGLSPGELCRRVPEFGGLIVRGATKVTREVIEAGKNLRVIGRAGVGLDNIDTEAAADRGIRVLNVPEGLSIAVAELTLGLMLALARHIPEGTASLKAGKWEKSALVGTELYKKVLGIIGLGGIGRMVAARAQAFGMRVIGYDVAYDSEPFDEVLTTADYLSIHVPLTDDTHHLLSDREFAQMKTGVFLVNAARGGVVDETALLRALNEGKVAGAALDVFETEPPGDNPLLRHPRVIGTPHLGASTREAQISVGVTIAKNVVTALLEQG